MAKPNSTPITGLLPSERAVISKLLASFSQMVNGKRENYYTFQIMGRKGEAIRGTTARTYAYGFKAALEKLNDRGWEEFFRTLGVAPFSRRSFNEFWSSYEIPSTIKNELIFQLKSALNAAGNVFRTDTVLPDAAPPLTRFINKEDDDVFDAYLTLLRKQKERGMFTFIAANVAQAQALSAFAEEIPLEELPFEITKKSDDTYVIISF